MTERRKVRWLIAHYPVYLFVRTAKKFTEELEKLCPGQFEIEIHTIDSYVAKYNGAEAMRLIPPNIRNLEEISEGRQDLQVKAPKDIRTKWTAIFDSLRAGDFELSQTQVSIVGEHLHKNFNALDLPFLFDSHDHVTRVLDGDIGDQLCEELGEKTDIKGLAFTYSGGYRVIGSTHEITNLTELAQTKLLTTTTPSTILFREAGAKPLPRGHAEVSDLGDLAESGAVETTYLRFTGKHVFKTDHSIFMTTILTGNGFWDTLTPEQQDAFKIAAKSVAKTERIWSVEDADKYEREAEAKGVKIVDITDADRAYLKKSAQASYRAIKSVNIDPTLVRNIIASGDRNQ